MLHFIGSSDQHIVLWVLLLYDFLKNRIIF